MGKGPTKAQQALAEAREWIEASKEEIKEREAALVEAQGQLVMHETIYAILEKTLTRQSSVKAAKKSSTKRAGKKSASKGASKSSRASSLANRLRITQAHPGANIVFEPLCLTCGNVEDFEDHSQPSPNYHPFDVPPHVRGAGERSSTNGGATNSTPSSEAEPENVSTATGG